MRIRLNRSGGFTGIRLEAEVDTAELPPEEGRRVEQMVDAADVFGLPARGSRAAGADRFQYLLTVEAEDGHHSARLTEEDIHANRNLERLVEYLIDAARSRPPR